MPVVAKGSVSDFDVASLSHDSMMGLPCLTRKGETRIVTVQRTEVL